MAQLVDFSQIVIGSYMTVAKHTTADIDTLRPLLPNQYKPFSVDGDGLEFYLTEVPLELAEEII